MLRIRFETGARPWTSREKKFILDTLNDVRAWPFRWTTIKQGQADWTVSLEHQKLIDTLFVDHGQKDTGLSVTLMDSNLTLFSLENWSSVPKTAPKAYNLAQYRTYLVLHECGHALGLGHPVVDLQSRTLAPIMIQQTRGIGHMHENIWPTFDECTSVLRQHSQ